MPIDLVRAARIALLGREVGEIGHLGSTRWKPWVDPFPAGLLAAGGTYHHFAAEDAGTVWASRHGSPLSLARSGQPTQGVSGGLAVVNCAVGCYELIRATAMASASPFTVWALCEHATGGQRAFYNGPEADDGRTNVLAMRLMDCGLFVGAKLTTFTHRSTASMRSYEWTRTGGGAVSSVMEVYENALRLSVAVLGDRTTDASGRVFMVGGARGANGSPAYGALKVRDVVLTQGWVLSASQRAALDSYRQARLAG